MENFEQEKGFEAVAPGAIAELYGLVHLGLDQHDVRGDEVARFASFGRYSREGLYSGFVDFEAINPLLAGNRIGLCATVHVGELAEGVPLGVEDFHARTNLDHVIKNYYIYYDGPNLKVVKGTDIQKPAEIDSKTEAEDLIELASPHESLNEVYTDELEEVIAEVKKALGIKKEVKAEAEAEGLVQSTREAKGFKKKIINILGKIGLK